MEKSFKIIAVLVLGLLANSAFGITKVPYMGVEYMKTGSQTYMKIEDESLKAGDFILITDKRGSEATKKGKIIKKTSSNRYIVEILSTEKVKPQ